jgi:hypothetical protein
LYASGEVIADRVCSSPPEPEGKQKQISTPWHAMVEKGDIVFKGVVI